MRRDFGKLVFCDENLTLKEHVVPFLYKDTLNGGLEAVCGELPHGAIPLGRALPFAG